jgi:hypothetical protein
MTAESKYQLTADEVRRLFDYDPNTGAVTRRVTTGPTGRAGATVGSIDPNGYLRTQIRGHVHLLHRVVWLHHYGTWPSGWIDHINRNPADNRIDNLRLATRSLNNRNRTDPYKSSATGLLGVSKRSDSSRFTAYICVDGKNKYLGNFKTAEQAHAAYTNAKSKYHPGAVL